MIRQEIEGSTPIKTTIKYLISLPQEEAHTGHPVGQAGVYAQNLNPCLLWYIKLGNRYSREAVTQQDVTIVILHHI